MTEDSRYKRAERQGDKQNRARSWDEHLEIWKHPIFARTIGIPFWWLQKIATWYDNTSFSYSLRVLEPLGVAIATVSLIGTLIALCLTVKEIRDVENVRQEERSMRRASLLALLYERLEEARRRDAGLLAAQKHTRAGQIPIFEEMAQLDLNLNFVDASGVNLVASDTELVKVGAVGIQLVGGNLRNAKFENSNLAVAQFMGAKLWKAKFVGSYLLFSNFTKAKLSYADFTNAQANTTNFTASELRGTVFENTNISHASFLNARFLTQKQLDSACAHEGAAPLHLPIDYETNNQLVWHTRVCPEIGR